MNAAAQNFNSVGIAFGSMIAFASYNKVNNRSIMMDTVVICCLNSATSILAGIIVFATLGNIAKELQAKIEDVVIAGNHGDKATDNNKSNFRHTSHGYKD